MLIISYINIWIKSPFIPYTFFNSNIYHFYWIAFGSIIPIMQNFMCEVFFSNYWHVVLALLVDFCGGQLLVPVLSLSKTEVWH